MRIVKHALGVFCLLAALLLVVVWVRSYWVGDQLRRTWYAEEGTRYIYYQESMMVGRGQLACYRAGIGWALDGPLHVSPGQMEMPEEPLSYKRGTPLRSETR